VAHQLRSSDTARRLAGLQAALLAMLRAAPVARGNRQVSVGSVSIVDTEEGVLIRSIAFVDTPTGMALPTGVPGVYQVHHSLTRNWR
jgi:hypothetical protein